MINYDTVNVAVKDTLEADVFFSGGENIRTIESHERPFSLQGEEGPPIFKSEEMPALNVILPSGSVEEDLSTTQEVRRFIPGKIMVRSLHENSQDGMVEQYLLVENVERILNAQKTSVKDLGIGAYVKDVSSETVRYKKENQTIIETAVTFVVDVTTTI